MFPEAVSEPISSEKVELPDAASEAGQRLVRFHTLRPGTSLAAKKPPTGFLRTANRAGRTSRAIRAAAKPRRRAVKRGHSKVAKRGARRTTRNTVRRRRAFSRKWR